MVARHPCQQWVIEVPSSRCIKICDDNCCEAVLFLAMLQQQQNARAVEIRWMQMGLIHHYRPSAVRGLTMFCQRTQSDHCPAIASQSAVIHQVHFADIHGSAVVQMSVTHRSSDTVKIFAESHALAIKSASMMWSHCGLVSLRKLHLMDCIIRADAFAVYVFCC